MTIMLAGRRLARTRTDRRGSFSVRVRIRARRTGRQRLVVASGRTRVAKRFTVLTAGTAPSPAPARDPVIAAAGDIACHPASPDYNGGAGTATSCRQRAVSDLVVNQGLARVLTLGDQQYEDDSLPKYA